MVGGHGRFGDCALVFISCAGWLAQAAIQPLPLLPTPLIEEFRIGSAQLGFWMKKQILRQWHFSVSDHRPNLGQDVLAVVNTVLIPFRHIPMATAILHVFFDQPRDRSDMTVRRPGCALGMAVLARTL